MLARVDAPVVDGNLQPDTIPVAAMDQLLEFIRTLDSTGTQSNTATMDTNADSIHAHLGNFDNSKYELNINVEQQQVSTTSSRPFSK